MRRSEFAQLADHVFGPVLAAAYRRDLVLEAVGGMTADDALEAGVPVRAVWTALCEEMRVPEHRRWEVPPGERAQPDAPF